MNARGEIKKSIGIALWFMALTFPVMVIRVNTIERVVEWRWRNMAFIGIGSFLLSFAWRLLLARKERGRGKTDTGDGTIPAVRRRLLAAPGIRQPALAALALSAAAFPFLFSSYQTNIMTTALMYVMLGLGLNIVVGLAGLLDLGYVAFYAVGAYSYALLNHHFGLGFWAALPVGALLSVLFALALGFPILRLRGDYLAIVTLGFCEITRLVLENWNEFSFGPSGIANISRPGLFGLRLTLHEATIYFYFIVLGLCLATLFVVRRLQHSRVGRAWVALREDEIACEAMGIDKARAKLTAYTLGAAWAGMVGVLFAAKTTFINPASFTFLESAMILSIVVLGGMGSIMGIVVGAFLLILTPEYLRAFSSYRMLLFGTVMVLMMVFRPQGIVANVRQVYRYRKQPESEGCAGG